MVMTKELVKVVQENRFEIIEYLEDVFEQYVEEDCVQSVDDMEDMFRNDEDFMLDHMIEAFIELDLNSDLFNGEIVDEIYDEVIDVLFG